MSILDAKDANRLETVRYLRDDIDPWFAPVLNRPLEDIRQRTVDVHTLFFPARGLYVHGPTSESVIVDPGYVSLDYRANPSYYAGGSVVLFPAAPGQRRIDLVYYDAEALSVGVSSGVEVSDTTSWSALFADKSKLGILPFGSVVLPLAYTYVDSTPGRVYSVYTDSASAGHIRPARLSPGAGNLLYSDLDADMLTDASGGATGSSEKLVRVGHRHPLLYNATDPPTLLVEGSSGQGSVNSYALIGHTHPLQMLNNSLLLDSSDGSAYIGDSNDYTFVRGDHSHPQIHGSSLPTALEAGVAANPGSAVPPVLLAHADHEHPVSISKVKIRAKHFTLSWNNDATAKSTGAVGFTPTAAYVFGAIYAPADNTIQSISFGFAEEAGGCRGSAGRGNYGDNDSHWGCAHDSNQIVGASTTNINLSFSTAFNLTAWSAAGMQLTPEAALTANLNVIIVGVET